MEINKYNEILNIDPENEICLFNKAYALYKKEELNEASKINEQLINKNNDNIDLKFGLGICYHKLIYYL